MLYLLQLALLLERVCEIHLAGYEPKQGYLLDAHNNLVSAPVWDSYDMARFSALAAGGLAEQARFWLSAALRLLASDYPIREIWSRHQQGGDTSASLHRSRDSR